MGRPRKITFVIADFCGKAMDRLLLRMADDPKWVPAEADMKVVKMMAETQVIIAKAQEKGGGKEEVEPSGMTVEELEQYTQRQAQTPRSTGDGDDA